MINSVLLIDDNKSTNFLHSRVLKKSGKVKHIKFVENAQDALNYLTTAINDGTYPCPDIIFLDINMPGMNGWQFLEVYRALPKKQRGGIVVVMLTTSLDPDDRARARNIEEINEFEHKPLGLKNFEALVDKYFGNK